MNCLMEKVFTGLLLDGLFFLMAWFWFSCGHTHKKESLASCVQLSLSQSVIGDSVCTLHECIFEYVIVYSQKREGKKACLFVVFSINKYKCQTKKLYIRW